MTGTVATELISGDRIMLSVSAKEPNGQRVNISATFDQDGQQVDAGGDSIGGPGLSFGAAASGPAPAFPTSEYKALVEQNRKAEADALTVAYKQAFDAYTQSNPGASTLAVRIGNAVYRWLTENHDVRETDHAGLVLRRDQVLTRIPLREGPTSPAVFTIQLAPVWG